MAVGTDAGHVCPEGPHPLGIAVLFQTIVFQNGERLSLCSDGLEGLPISAKNGRSTINHYSLARDEASGFG